MNLEQLVQELGVESTEVETTAVASTETEVEVVADSEPAEVQQARAAGWRPKEEYTGDPDKWVDAGEFVRRGQLFEKISTQSRELKELRKVVEGLTEHNRKLAEQEKHKEISNLKHAKKLAMEEGDTAAVIEIDELLLDRKAELKEAQKQSTAETAQQIHPAYWEFAQANPWYTKDRAMTAFADSLGAELHAQGYSDVEVYQAVAKEVRKEFPHKFNRKPASASAVETPTSTNKQAGNKFQPTAEERGMAAMFERQGIMTAAEYYEQLKKAR